MNSKQFTIRVGNILSDCDIGLITDEQGINKIMRSYAKYVNSRFECSLNTRHAHFDKDKIKSKICEGN